MLPQHLRLVPCNNEKRPLISNWVERASSDPRQHRAWESEFPNCLWGIITGELFDVIDVDPKGIPWALEHERDLLTYTQTTRRRGRHYYFLPTPGLKNSTSKVAPGVDVKTIG